MTEEPNPLQKRLHKLCLDMLAERNWRAFDDIQVQVPDKMPAPMAAFITLNDRRITIQAAADVSKHIDSTVRAHKLDIERDEFLSDVVNFLVAHEYGHHRHCPITRERFQAILAGSYEAIKDREYNTRMIQEKCLYLHNLFSDTVLNTVNSHKDMDPERYRRGFDLTYLLFSQGQRQMAGIWRRSDKGFTLFSQTQKALSQTSPEVAKMMRKYEPWLFPSLPRLRRQLITVFTGDEEASERFETYQATGEDKRNMLDRITDAESWGKMAYEYTNIMYPFIRTPDPRFDNSFSRKQQGGSGQKSDPSERGTPQKGPGSEKNKGGDGDGQKKKNKEDDKGGSDQKKKGRGEDQGRGSCKPGEKKHDDGSKSGGFTTGDDLTDEFFRRLLENTHAPGSSPFLLRYRELDRMYRGLAGKAYIKARQGRNPDSQYTHRIGVDEIPPGEFNSRTIDWASTRIWDNDQGETEIELFQHDLDIDMNIPGAEEVRGVPDLGFIFDTSISMTFNPFQQQGDYHLAVLGFYSIMRGIEETGVAPLLSYNALNFSHDTTSSGWCRYDELEKVKRTLFDYQGLGTVLNPTALRNMRRTRKDNFIAFMLSDGGFNSPENQEAVLEEIGSMIDTGGIDLYHFQIGADNSFCQSLRQMGAGVQLITSAEDFVNMSIEITEDRYKQEGII